MIKQLTKFLDLSRREKALLLQVYLIFLLTRAGLTLLPFKSVRKAMNRLSGHRARRQLSKEQIVRSLERLKRYVPANTCLTQALTCDFLLKRHRHDSHLKIGVSTEPKGFEAHAWVESDGAVVMGGIEGMERYHPIPSVDSAIQ